MMYLNKIQPYLASAAQPGPLSPAFLQPVSQSGPLLPQLELVPTELGRPYHTPPQAQIITLRPRIISQALRRDHRRLLVTRSPGGGVAMEPVSTMAETPFDPLYVAILAKQLLSIPSFSGDNVWSRRELLRMVTEARTSGHHLSVG